MSAHVTSPQIDAAVMQKLFVALLAHQARYPNGINEAKRAFHRVIGPKKTQIPRTAELETLIAYLIHEATDMMITDDADDDHADAVLGKRVKSLLQHPSGRPRT